jgi:anti-sigma-K factor RskA
MINHHVVETAELYALGALSDDERSAIDAHARGCSQCARVLASAEHDVALIASMEPLHDAPPELQQRIDALVQTRSLGTPTGQLAQWRLPAAVAAALIAGLLPSAYFWSQNSALHDAMVAQSAAVVRLASAPHRTANFIATTPSAAAQVMYAPDGSWYVVIVRGVSKPLGVAWMHDGRQTMLGEATPHGNVAMLYLSKSHRMNQLALMDGNRIVAQATLSWQKTSPNPRAGRSS